MSNSDEFLMNPWGFWGFNEYVKAISKQEVSLILFPEFCNMHPATEVNAKRCQTSKHTVG